MDDKLDECELHSDQRDIALDSILEAALVDYEDSLEEKTSFKNECTKSGHSFCNRDNNSIGTSGVLEPGIELVGSECLDLSESEMRSFCED